MRFPEIEFNRSYVRWDDYAPSDRFLYTFKKEDWEKVSGEINSSDDWDRFVSENKEYFKCFVLRKGDCPNILAMLYLVNENLDWTVVSVHGGAVSGCSAVDMYRGYILMLEALLDANIKVRTACHVDNTKAIRLNRSLGFVKYQLIGEKIGFWINKKRLTSSSIYKYLQGH